MPLFAAVVPPECHMWVYNPKKFSARFARINVCTPTLKIVAPHLASRGKNVAFLSSSGIKI